MEALTQPTALRNTPLELPYVPAGQAAHMEDLEAPAARENCTDAVTRTVASTWSQMMILQYCTGTCKIEYTVDEVTLLR